jgi:hypothetical protein
VAKVIKKTISLPFELANRKRGQAPFAVMEEWNDGKAMR